jgi:hypothetical protein
MDVSFDRYWRINPLALSSVRRSHEWHGMDKRKHPVTPQVKVSGSNVYLIQDGKIAREWEQMDSLGMLKQLGVLPAPSSQAGEPASQPMDID